MLMRGSRFLWGTMVVVMFASLNACSSNDLTGPTGDLTDEERAAIAQALATTGGLTAAPAAGFAAFLVDGITGLGQMTASAAAARVEQAVTAGVNLAVANGAANSYEGFGVVVGYDVTVGGTTTTGWMAGIVGFNNLDVQSGSVDNLVTAFVLGSNGATPPATASGSLDNGSAFSTYYGSSTTYLGTTGTVAITSSAFAGSAADCSGTVQGVTVTCSVASGAMAGNFAFDAATTGGGQTFTQVPIGFQNLPSVFVQLSTNAGN